MNNNSRAINGSYPHWSSDKKAPVSYCIASCGLCCHSRTLCSSCVEATLKSNGLTVIPENIARIKDLPHRNNNSFDPIGCSELGMELAKISKEENDGNKN